MKYLVLSYNEYDAEWVYYGTFDTYEDAVKRITDKEDKQAHFTLRDTPPDVLEGVYSDWSGHDQYFIFPCRDQS